MSYTQLEVNLRAAGAGFDKVLVLSGSGHAARRLLARPSP
jgi:hypothetical protein